MFNTASPAIRSQTLIATVLFGFALWAAWKLGGTIAEGDNDTLLFVVLGTVVCGVAVAILKDWRLGTFAFIGWLTFEDFIRKYMSNSVALFFGKDVLVALVYLAFYAALRAKKERSFRPPFLFFLSMFFWLGALQMFNQNSVSIFYGLLGFKVYFYYVPLIFIGYAFVRSDEDLRRFLTWNLVIAGIVAGVGIAQSILGNSFLNPVGLAPELQQLGDLSKVTPISGQEFNIPPSVFVSSGRYSLYLILAITLSLGTAGYLLFTTKRGRAIAYVVSGMLGAAALLSGSRGSFLWVFITAAVLPIGFLWGAPWRQGEGRRMFKAIRWSAALFVLGLIAVVAIFPDATGSRIAFYSETLLPSSSSYQLSTRTWDYPVEQLMNALHSPNWIVGNGIGTASLGMQYVEKLTGTYQATGWVEEGYGNLIMELGILGPILWILWTSALLYFSWKVVRQLRQTRYFPLALAITWYAFLLLFPFTYENLDAYQNYLCNAYLWLLIGILFRLPELQFASAEAAAVVPQRAPVMPRRAYSFYHPL